MGRFPLVILPEREPVRLLLDYPVFEGYGGAFLDSPAFTLGFCVDELFGSCFIVEEDFAAAFAFFCMGDGDAAGIFGAGCGRAGGETNGNNDGCNADLD